MEPPTWGHNCLKPVTRAHTDSENNGEARGGDPEDANMPSADHQNDTTHTSAVSDDEEEGPHLSKMDSNRFSTNLFPDSNDFWTTYLSAADAATWVSTLSARTYRV